MRMIRLGGIKFSEELVQFTVTRTSSADSSIHELLQSLTAKKINIPFLCSSAKNSKYKDTTTFCVAQIDYESVKKIICSDILHLSTWFSTDSVGTVTVFPHKNSFLILGKILSIFADRNFPVYSISSSISALAVNSDYNQLDNIALNLQQHFELPENHAPFRPEFQLKELPE